MISLAISTAYGYGYTSAQSKATTELTLHVIEDKRVQVEDAHIHSLKDLEIEKLKVKIERLEDDLNTRPASPPKEAKWVEKARKLR